MKILDENVMHDYIRNKVYVDAVTAYGQKNKRCSKRQILTSLLSCGNPNAYHRHVKFSVRRANTIQQKNQGVAAFLFKFFFKFTLQLVQLFKTSLLLQQVLVRLPGRSNWT